MPQPSSLTNIIMKHSQPRLLLPVLSQHVNPLQGAGPGAGRKVHTKEVLPTQSAGKVCCRFPLVQFHEIAHKKHRRMRVSIINVSYLKIL